MGWKHREIVFPFQADQLSENQCGMETTMADMSFSFIPLVEREPMWDGNVI